MNEKLQALFTDLIGGFILFFPKLLAGIILLIIGWFLAWFAKRLVVHISIILRLEHLLARSRWKTAFEKADVRYGLYNFLGNIFFIIVFLIFLDFALITLELKILSQVIESAILLFPRLLTSAVIFGAGWIIARTAANALYRIMAGENFKYASGVAGYARTMLIVLFSAMALMELNIAREVVLIGFSTILVMMGAIAVIAAGLGWNKLSGTPGESARPVEESPAGKGPFDQQ